MNNALAARTTQSHFKFKAVKDSYSIKIKAREHSDLNGMLMLCIDHAEAIEKLVLEELRRLVEKKEFKQISRIKLLPSQAVTLFLWLNDFTFEHPLHNRLAGILVDQLYRQMI